jgi:uncharacterized Zn finger protein (UPF0148 family)
VGGGQRDDDKWSQQMSSLLLNGWKMLNEQCPTTGLVPLMEHPVNGRKFSVATNRFCDEPDDGAAEAEQTTSTAPPPKSVDVAVPATTTSVEEVSIGAEAAPPSFGGYTRAKPTSRPEVVAPVASPIRSAVVPKPAAPAPAAKARPSQSEGALDAAASAIREQLAACTEQLAAAPPPPPPELLVALGQCAGALATVEKARRALLND